MAISWNTQPTQPTSGISWNNSQAPTTQTQPAAPQQSSNPIWDLLSAPANYLKGAMNDQAASGANDINQGITTIQNPSGTPGQNPILGGIQAAGQVGTGVAKVASSAFAGLFNPIGQAANAGVDKIAQVTKSGQYGNQAFQQADQQFANSPAGIKTAGVLQSASDYGNIAGTILGADQVVKAAPQAFTDTASQVKDFMKTSPEVKAAKLNAEHTTTMGDEIGRISDMIAPKVNAAETKLALAEGRIAPGEDPTLLRDGTPDQVLPSTKQAQASFTIHQNILNADKMSTPELYTALGKNISQTAKALRPVMDSTPISEATVTKLVTDYSALKAKQLADPYTPTTANLEKLQANFEQNFLDKTSLDNMGNLWDTRIKYDNSVPSSVKNAHSNSSETLQAQKSIWLQNREILNSAINDSASGLGGTSEKAFSNMSDMYNAQRGIQSSYRVPKTGEPSIAKQFTKDHPVVTGVIKAGAKAVGLGAGVHLGEGLVP